jgi:hypothetical protein
MPAGRATYRCQGLSPLLRHAPRKRGIQQSPRVLWLLYRPLSRAMTTAGSMIQAKIITFYPRSRSGSPNRATSARSRRALPSPLRASGRGHPGACALACQKCR